MKENNNRQPSQDQEEKNKVTEIHAGDNLISAHTEVKNAHASGLGSMGRNDEEESGEGRTEKD